MEVRRTSGSSVTLCAEILRAIDRIYAVEGADEPDLALNVTYVTTRRSLQRLASAEAWEPPAPVAAAIRARLRFLEAIRDPERLMSELLSFPTWALRSLDRRDAWRRPQAGATPRRRAGDRPLLPREVGGLAGDRPGLSA